MPAPQPYEKEADESLATMLGGEKGLNQVFSESNIQRAQTLIDNARAEFFTRALPPAIDQRERVLAVKGMPPPAVLKPLCSAVRSLQLQAQALHFPFIATICLHIEEVCNAGPEAKFNAPELLRQLLGLLVLTLQKQIVDEGGKTGQDIAASLAVIASRIRG